MIVSAFNKLVAVDHLRNKEEVSSHIIAADKYFDGFNGRYFEVEILRFPSIYIDVVDHVCYSVENCELLVLFLEKEAEGFVG